jgi:hypothetical protein
MASALSTVGPSFILHICLHRTILSACVQLWGCKNHGGWTLNLKVFQTKGNIAMRPKSVLAVDKHVAALEGTGFERCATCPGSGGKVVDGCMNCSRAGASPVLITVTQAKCCDGTKPPPYHTKKKQGRMRAQNHHQLLAV